MRKFDKNLIQDSPGKLEIWLEKCYPGYGKVITQALEEQGSYLKYFKSIRHGIFSAPCGFPSFKIKIAEDFDCYPSQLGTKLMEFYSYEEV